MNVEADLILKAAALARSSPENWNRFVAAMRAYSDRQAQNCIQSALEELPRTQGRAQTAAYIHGLLAECLSRADKIEGTRK